MPQTIQGKRENCDIGQAHRVIGVDGRAGNEAPSVQVKGERGEDMDEDGGELVKAVEHQAVLPDYDSEHKYAHAEDIVCLNMTTLHIIHPCYY